MIGELKNLLVVDSIPTQADTSKNTIASLSGVFLIVGVLFPHITIESGYVARQESR